MKHIFLFIVALAFFAQQNLVAQNGWFHQANVNTNSYTITSIEFSSLTEGCLVANYGTMGYVFSTVDGGNNWVYDTSFTTNLSQIEIINGQFYVVGNSGAIYKKPNASANWTPLTSTTTVNLSDVYFVTTDTGYVVGAAGVLRKTVDAGLTWTNPIVSGYNYDFNSVFFTSNNVGYIVGVYNFFQGFAIKTTSGGQYWGALTTMPSKLNKVVFTSANMGYAIGNGGVIYKTTTGGSGWILKTSGVTDQLWDVSFLNDTIGYIVGENGKILKTLNGGDSWLVQPSPFSSALKATFAHSTQIAWAAGDSSRVLKTLTGGINLSVSVADTAAYCNGFVQLNSSINYNGLGVLQYSWSSNQLLSDTAVANPIVGPINQNATFYLTVTDGQLTATDSATVTLAVLPSDSICLVSVLDSLNYNVVVFEKHVLGPIDYYKIYKETFVANVYDSIGFIPADSVGIFIDTIANPMVQAYRYKISSVDSCGHETTLSNSHKTLHLTINQGLPGTWNLLWNNYEGVFINTYRIWRGDSLYNLVLIDSVAGNMTSYTDLNPPSNSVFYQIEIVSSYMCLPYDYKAQTNYNTSRSNKANTGAPPTITAAFGATPTSGIAPLTVFFTDNSMGSADDWFWDFGDGDTAMIANPSHTYLTPGIYDVKFKVKSGMLSDSVVKTAYIDVISSIEDIDLAKVLKVYPNPINPNQNLMIDAGGALLYSVELFDIYGRKISEVTELRSTKTQIDISKFSHGVYNLKIFTVGGKVANKLIIIEI